MTDFHAHILPGLDDGPRTMQESAACVAFLAGLGFRRVYLTPHFRPGVFDNPPSRVRASLDYFRTFLGDRAANIDLRPSHEVHLDSVLDPRGNLRAFLPIGAAGRHLLLEVPLQIFPFDLLLRTVDRLFSEGLRVVLAHPERHAEVVERQDRCRMLKEAGVKFQVNVTSLAGFSGPVAARRARVLCLNGLVDALGTDTHSLAQVREWVPKGLQQAARLLGEAGLQAVMSDLDIEEANAPQAKVVRLGRRWS